jgi:TP901 family phage tail tape measure protein
MASVGKVLNLKTGSAELKAVGAEVQNIAEYLATSPEDAAALYASLAQGGAARDQLSDIARIAGEVGVAFEIDPGTAGERFIKLQNAMELTTAEAKMATDAINFLSDNSAAKASEMLDFFASGGAGASRALDITAAEGAALSSVYISMGKSGSEAATIVERMTKTLRNQGKEAGKVYAAAGGGMEGVLAVIETGEKLQGAAKFDYFKQFGEYGVEVEQMANNSALLAKQLGYVADESAYAGSVQAEFVNQSNTTAFKLRQAQTNAENLAILIGNELLPVITDITEAVMPVIDSISAWVSENPALTKTILKVTAAVGAILGVLAAVGFIISGVATTVGVLATAFSVVASLPFIIGAALVGAGILIYKNWDKIKTFFGNALAWIKETGSKIPQMLADGIKATLMMPYNLAKTMVEKVRNLLPFSPAKEGPLRDLHKIKLVETIAATIKPAPLVNATSNALSSFAGMSSPKPQAQGALGGSINYSPIVNISGAASERDRASFAEQLRAHSAELERMLTGIQQDEIRRSY